MCGFHAGNRGRERGKESEREAKSVHNVAEVGLLLK